MSAKNVEWKTIILTSAMAAAGTAIATSIVDLLLTKYLLKQKAEAGPQFVVVPVVEREVPALPPEPLSGVCQPFLHKGASFGESVYAVL